MNPRHWSVAVIAVAFLVTTGVFAQEHTKFDDHDRQVTRDWYAQHERNAPRGFRASDRLSADLEARLQAGRPLDRDLRRRAYSTPAELRRQLPPAPRNHKYVVIGGHVVLVESGTYVVRDVIHVH